MSNNDVAFDDLLPAQQEPYLIKAEAELVAENYWQLLRPSRSQTIQTRAQANWESEQKAETTALPIEACLLTSPPLLRKAGR